MRVTAAWARLCAFGASLAIGLSLAAVSRAADTYPDHKVRLIVPFAAGGPTDVIARMVAERLSQAWGQQLYVENMPGAGGNLGVETGGRAAPDGYTIVAVSTGFIINPSMYSKIGYDPVKDFAPISLVAASPNVVTAHPSLPAKNLKELIDLIKANPGKYSYAQPATGSTPHLAGELFKQTYNLDLVTVPFNGAPLAINSALGNHTPIAFTALPPAIGNIKDGSLRGIAVLAKARADTSINDPKDVLDNKVVANYYEGLSKSFEAMYEEMMHISTRLECIENSKIEDPGSVSQIFIRRIPREVGIEKPIEWQQYSQSRQSSAPQEP